MRTLLSCKTTTKVLSGMQLTFKAPPCSSTSLNNLLSWQPDGGTNHFPVCFGCVVSALYHVLCVAQHSWPPHRTGPCGGQRQVAAPLISSLDGAPDCKPHSRRRHKADGRRGETARRRRWITGRDCRTVEEDSMARRDGKARW